MRVSLPFVLALLLLPAGVPAFADAADNNLLAARQPLAESAQQEPANPDPLEKFNRFMFKMNDELDRYLLVPAAYGYRAVVPNPARKAILNFSRTFVLPNTLGYQVLQGKPGKAGMTLARLLINLTLGFGGIFDPATDMGLPHYTEDFGQTLGVWGVGPGPYLVLPFLGPSTLRDTLAKIPQYLFSVEQKISDEDRINFIILDTLAFRESLLGAEKLLPSERYLAFRNVYLERRKRLINDCDSGSKQKEACVDTFFERFLDDLFLDEEEEAPASSEYSLPLSNLALAAGDGQQWQSDFPRPISLYSRQRMRMALLRSTLSISLLTPPDFSPRPTQTPPQEEMSRAVWSLEG